MITANRRAVLRLGAASATLLAALSLVYGAATHDVQMLNVHPENKRLRQVFFPRVLALQPGDTVNFAATDRGHNSATVDGMIPDGTDGCDGKINENVSVALEAPGFYGYQCTPHSSTGMVGLVVVEGDGMLANLEAAQDVRQRGKAKAVWEEIWEEVAGLGLIG